MDIDTAGDDDRLLPPGHGEEAVGIDTCKIAGVIPVISEHGRGLFGLAKVAFHNIAAADPEFANLPWREVVAAVVNDASLAVDGLSDGAEFVWYQGQDHNRVPRKPFRLDHKNL